MRATRRVLATVGVAVALAATPVRAQDTQNGADAPVLTDSAPTPTPSPNDASPAVDAPDAAAAEPDAVAPTVDSTDPDALAACLVAHSGQADSDAMRKVMVAALSNDTVGLKGSLSEFSGLLLKLSMTSCGVTLTQLQDPAYNPTFRQASSQYGSALGAKLMQDAFAKLN